MVAPLPRVVVIGAGFGGLFTVRTLVNQPVDVLLIDRRNYHTFTPLLYQVATCALDPSEIAYPIRTIFRNAHNVQTLLGELTGIDPAQRQVTIQTLDGVRLEPYDYLVLAPGSIPAYFGDETFRQAIQTHAWDLRTLEDAVDLRNHILNQFERAAWSQDPAAIEAMTTIVVVGGGPTGLETAGAIYELYNHALATEYRQRNLHARVVLVELQPYLLAPYPDALRVASRRQLESLGVEVLLGCPVAQVSVDEVVLADNTRIPTHTLVWAAGVRASPVAELLPVPLARGGRLPVDPTMRVTGLERIYAVGDMTYLEDSHGQTYPQLIPVAQQQGILAAQNILADLADRPPHSFQYHDRGMMATIGRSRAVAWLYNRIPLQGYLAWLVWLFLHLATLLGFRNRLSVFLNWVWNYFTYDRSVRIILQR